MKKIFLFFWLSSVITLIFLVKNSQAQWIRLGTFPFSQTWVEAIAGNGSNIFAGTHNNSVFLSTDNGTTWTAVSSGLPSGSITYRIVINGNVVFTATDNNWGIYKTTNNGSNWTQSGLSGIAISCLTLLGTNLFAGSVGYGVYLSTDNGTNWKAVNNGLGNNKAVLAFGTSGTTLYAGTTSGIGNGVFSTTDSGSTWVYPSNTGFPSTTVKTLNVIGNNLFVGSLNGGVALSTNGGANWTNVNNGLTNLNVLSSIAVGSNLLVGTSGGGIFLSTNNGANWTTVNTGLGNLYIHSLALIGSALYAGTLNSGIWRRPFSEITSSIEEFKETSLPLVFALNQNYPNPFNPITKIDFDIPFKTVVKIDLFNIVGEKIASLLNEEKDAGNYSLNFNASKLESGVYFYRLSAEEFSQIRKMSLIK